MCWPIVCILIITVQRVFCVFIRISGWNRDEKSSTTTTKQACGAHNNSSNSPDVAGNKMSSPKVFIVSPGDYSRINRGNRSRGRLSRLVEMFEIRATNLQVDCAKPSTPPETEGSSRQRPVAEIVLGFERLRREAEKAAYRPAPSMRPVESPRVAELARRFESGK